METSEDSEIDIVAATDVTLGMRWDGVDTVKFFVNRLEVNEISTNLPDDELLSVTYALQNGEAVAKTATIDYLYLAQER